MYIDEEKTLPSMKQKILTRLQMCFVIDATGSMEGYVELVKNSLLKIFDLFEEYSLTNQTQIGFVFYRDFSEGDPLFAAEMKQYRPEYWQPQQKIEFIDFDIFTAETAKPGGKIYDYLQDLTSRCDGGDDYAEDVAGGLAQMLQLSWIPDKLTTKIAVLITDAPCHGKQFHDDIRDNFNDLSLKKEADIRPQLDNMIGKNINLTVIEINKATNIMVKEISNHYERQDKYYMFQSLKLVEDLDYLKDISKLKPEDLQLLTLMLLDKLELTLKTKKKI